MILHHSIESIRSVLESIVYPHVCFVLDSQPEVDCNTLTKQVYAEKSVQ